MRNITDFNDMTHRIESASAMFQKGIYHLFLLKRHDLPDQFVQVLLMYQCLFELNLTYLLLDTSFQIIPKDIQRRLSQRYCKNPKEPTRKEIDPAATITHSIFESGRWKGFRQDHPLHTSSKYAVNLYQRVVEARHNSIYRPFMLDNNFWEDCTLISLLASKPDIDELEIAYRTFISSLFDWHTIEEHEPFRHEALLEEMTNIDILGMKTQYARYFLQQLFIVYKDRGNNRPTETLLLSYARMLNPDNERILQEIREYRNSLIDIERVSKITLLPDIWQAGKL